MARIVFDLDGTLIDSAPDIHAMANRLLEREGRPIVTYAESRGFVGHGASVFVDRMIQARDLDPKDHPRLLAEFLALYETAVTLTRLYPGVPAALDVLASAGHALGICTNKPIKPTLAVLRHLELEPIFGAILGGDSLTVHKPNPAPLRATFDALPEGPEIYVGDSEVDAETAERAGVPFLLFTEGYRKSPAEALYHMATFDDFDALPGLVAEVLGTGS